MAKKNTSYTLSQEALDLLELLSKRLGLTKTAVLELIIREKSRSEGVKT